MEEDPHSEGSLLRFLRQRIGWSQDDLAAKTGLTRGAISQFENGIRTLKKWMARLTAAMGYGDVDVLFYRRLLRGLLPAAGEGRGARPDGLPPVPARLARSAAAAYGLGAAQEFELGLGGNLTHSAASAQRHEAERAFRNWAAAPAALQLRLVEGHPAYQTQGMVEQIVLASIDAAARDPKLALRYAQLALRAAENFAGPSELAARVRGYAWAFLGNAKRVGVGLREADVAFGHADRWWSEGEGAPGVFLEEWRFPDLKASLRRDQRLWKESLALSDQALTEAPSSARGRILVNKATALHQMGEWAKALPLLKEAKPLVEAGEDQQALLSLRINFASTLAHLGATREAGLWLKQGRHLALELGKDLEVVRCLWIGALIQGESGQIPGAIVALEQARRDFTAREMALEAADVALDEAVYLLQAGEFERVASLASEMAWIFVAESLGVDALKALRLFCEAAKARSLTVDLAREARELFRKAA